MLIRDSESEAHAGRDRSEPTGSPPLSVHGIGLIFARGRGIASLETALRAGWTPPSSLESPRSPTPIPVYTVPAEALDDRTALRTARRADRLTRMAVLAAGDALRECPVPIADRSRVGLLFATALGPHPTTFRFLDDILEYGDAAPSPTTFSHSVHNAAASYVAMALDIRGPTLTLTHFSFAFHHALLLAGHWLEHGICDVVLAGTSEECGSVMATLASLRLRLAPDGRIRPFALSEAPVAIPGEGSAFFVLTRQETAGAWGSVSAALDSPPPLPPPGLQILETDGLLSSETACRSLIEPGIPCAAYAPIFGSIPSGSALNTATGLLSLRRQETFATPAPDNPHGLLIAPAGPAPGLRQVASKKSDCLGRTGMVTLRRSAET
jgi:3-oxoacyl-[acyl-carrier-protein] synthase II